MPLFPAVLAAKVSTKAVKSPSSDNNNLSPPLDTIAAILLTCMVVSTVVLCVGFFRWKNYDLLLHAYRSLAEFERFPGFSDNWESSLLK